MKRGLISNEGNNRTLRLDCCGVIVARARELQMPARGRRTILVIDDDPQIRDMVAAILEPEGYLLQMFPNGLEALDYLRTHPAPNLILLDMLMPGMDGWGFMRERKREPDLTEVPVIVLSSVTTVVPGLIPEDATAAISKPFTVGSLVEAVRKHAR
jgi:CheY-like chemotaxis protein